MNQKAAPRGVSKLETKEDDINLVKSVFLSVGGKLSPIRIDKYGIITVERDNFMMDFENQCLSQNWDSSKRQHPKGPNRHEDPEWAEMIKSQIYPHHSDIHWDEYVEWVSRGTGDEWFRETTDSESYWRRQEANRDEDEFLPGYHEAQTRLRTSYLCKDMVRPCSTPLVERTLALAHLKELRCSGCGRGDDFCRCGGGGDSSIWWGS